jgi:hypothetical protein
MREMALEAHVRRDLIAKTCRRGLIGVDPQVTGGALEIHLPGTHVLDVDGQDRRPRSIGQ